MKVTISGSKEQKEEIRKYADMFMNAGCVVSLPVFMRCIEGSNHITLINDYMDDISYSDFLFVVNCRDGKPTKDSVFDMTFAKRCGVPVITNKRFTSMLEFYMSLKEE